MGDKRIVIVPNEYRDGAAMHRGITTKFHAEEILERKELGKRETTLKQNECHHLAPWEGESSSKRCRQRQLRRLQQ